MFVFFRNMCNMKGSYLNQQIQGKKKQEVGKIEKNGNWGHEEQIDKYENSFRL